jgi:hypothetical protein
MGCETSFSALHATFSLNHEPVSAASKTGGDEASESDYRSNFHLSRPYQFFTAIRSISIKKSRQPGDADQGERDMRWHRPEDAITLSMKAI